MHKCCDGLVVKRPLDFSHLAKTIEAAGTDVGRMPVNAEVGHYVDAKQADVVRGSDNISSELQYWSGDV